MSYTPKTWVTGDRTTATDLNHMEQGIANAGDGFDAIIRLTHGDNSGGDTPTNLTLSIISGTFDRLYGILDDGDVPNIRIEYYHPWSLFTTLTAFINYFNNNYISIRTTGYFPMDATFKCLNEDIYWQSDDTIEWND